jgi:hypothetical protein
VCDFETTGTSASREIDAHRHATRRQRSPVSARRLRATLCMVTGVVERTRLTIAARKRPGISSSGIASKRIRTLGNATIARSTSPSATVATSSSSGSAPGSRAMSSSGASAELHEQIEEPLGRGGLLLENIRAQAEQEP